MSNKHFIALADAIREHNQHYNAESNKFNMLHLETLAHFCKMNNLAFKQDRWLAYIAGKCGPNGGDIKS